jgi:hypothetical protein
MIFKSSVYVRKKVYSSQTQRKMGQLHRYKLEAINIPIQVELIPKLRNHTPVQ